MGTLWTGGSGRKLYDIIKEVGENRDYIIECRCLWDDPIDGPKDDLFGYCKWENKKLIPLDGDLYSLDDLYIQYKISPDLLTVWEEGVYEI